MVLFLLKSSACLAIFLMFYKLLLEKERMHIFKRYYLLAALVLSLVIPSITFTEYTEVGPIPSSSEPAPDAVPADSDLIGTTAKESVTPAGDERLMPTYNQSQRAVAEPAAKDYWSTLTFYGPLVLWTIYGLGVILFSLKFLINLWKLVCNVRNHPKIQIGSIVQVLLKDSLVPHTFWKYLFLNQQKFEANKIPREVLLHEATHAHQRHSVDVLFVELLQIVFWFNPLFHFTKKAIKLNHEFLADAAVLDQGASTPDYQNTVLAFASSADYKKYQPSMANAIHYSSYSSIKKRFTVMRTQTSKKSILLRSMMLLPLLALLFFGFSERQVVQKNTGVPEHTLFFFQEDAKEGATKAMMEEYTSFFERYREMEEKVINMDHYERMVAIYDLMTETQRTSVTDYKIIKIPDINLPKTLPNKPTQNHLALWKNKANCALWIDGKVVENSVLNQKEVSDFKHYTSSFVHKNARSERFPQDYQVHLYTENGFEETFVEADFNEYKRLNAEYAKERSAFINGTGTDDSDLRILKAQVNRAYDGLSEEEIKKYKVQRPEPLPDKPTVNKVPDEGRSSMQKGQSQIEMGEIHVAVNKNRQILVNDKLCTLDKLADRLKELKGSLNREGKRGVTTSLITDAGTPVEFSDQVRRVIQELLPISAADVNNLADNLPEMDTIYTYNRLAERIKTTTQNRNANVIYLKEIYAKMDDSQKSNVNTPAEIVKNVPSQEGATKKQLDEYNVLATKYNTMLANGGHIRIEESEVERLEYLHGIMTEEQRAEAEPFPDFPEPPEPPQPPVPPAPPSQEIEMEANIEKQRAIIQEQEVEMRKQTDRVKVRGKKRKEQQVQMQEQAARMKAQRKKLSRQRENMERQQKAMEKQRSKIEEQRMLMKKQQTEMQEQKTLGLEEVQIEENVIREIVEKQEIIMEERPLKTTPFWYLNGEGETKIYLEGKEISYAKMKKMEQDGMITSMNIIKKPNGNSLIKLNETGFRPQTPPVPPKPKSPGDLLEELKKDNVKIIFNGKEITYKMAKKVLEEDTNINVKVNRENGKRPVMELSSQ